MSYTPEELKLKLGSGLLSFPVSAFKENLEFDTKRYSEHLEWLGQYDVSGLFVSGGTGEFFSLTNEEIGQSVKIAKSQVRQGMPIMSAAGGRLPDALAQLRVAEENGADGVLVFPPYLTECGPEGLYDYVETLLKATSLPLIPYGRANAVYTADMLSKLADKYEHLIGYKDGRGQIDAITRIYTALQDRLLYIGGVPTAETYALPYLELGATTYSSAMFNFIPEFALKFFTAVHKKDKDFIVRAFAEFILPYLELRDRGHGYAVSMVKAGASITTGNDISRVRPPLTQLSDDEITTLTALIQKAQSL